MLTIMQTQTKKNTEVSQYKISFSNSLTQPKIYVKTLAKVQTITNGTNSTDKQISASVVANLLKIKAQATIFIQFRNKI